MASAGTYRLDVRLPAGSVQPERRDLGTKGQTNPERPSGIGLLRVGYSGAALGSPVTAMVAVGDNGSKLGPIDLPFLIVVEEPVTVELTPVVAPAADVQVVMGIVPLCVPIDGQTSASRAMTLLAGASVAIPQWVRSVTSIPAATFQFLDRASVPISGPLSGTYARPSGAAFVLCGAPGAIVFNY